MVLLTEPGDDSESLQEGRNPSDSFWSVVVQWDTSDHNGTRTHTTVARRKPDVSFPGEGRKGGQREEGVGEREPPVSDEGI